MGEQTFANSLAKVVAQEKIAADLRFGRPIAAWEMTRRELARLCREHAREALGLPLHP